MTIAIIVQARMGSKRFPGKIMAPFLPIHPNQGKRSVLENVLYRCTLANKADKVALATPNGVEHKPAWRIAERHDIYWFGGDEDDVLYRYYQIANELELANGDHIVRITADCPLIDPRVIDEAITLHLQQEADYTSNVLPRTYPKGLDVEVMTFDALETAWLIAHSQDDDLPVPEDILYMREHVTPWLQRDPDVKRANLRQKIDESEINLCVDYPEDPARIVALLEMLKGRKNKPAFWMPEKKGLLH
jgi:spore coat polysaccharide biosynthesis protein SpsF (cytidylyltransferase family)